jgi:hypothetical protein
MTQSGEHPVAETVDDAAWWDACDQPGDMLDVLADRDTESARYRAFCAALCRQVAHLLPHPAFRNAIALIEAWAAGSLPDDTRWDAEERLGALLESLPGFDDYNNHRVPNAGYAAAHAVVFALWSDLRQCHGNAEGTGYVLLHAADALALAKGASWQSDPDGWWPAVRREWAAQADLIRQVFGNPFRGPAMGPPSRPDV